MRILTWMFVMLLSSSLLLGQSKADWEQTRINLLFGLNQPLLGGFNVEGNVM